MNIPNLLTIVRMVLIPVFAGLYAAGRPVAALCVYVAACITDAVDGYLARRWNEVTAFGKLMDPLADKLLQLTMMGCLTLTGYIHWWVLAVMAAHFVLGPIGWKIGSAISAVVYAGISGSFRVLFGAVFGFFYAPLVSTGLHHMSNAIDTQLIADFGGTMLWPMIALSNIAQGSAVLGVIFLQRKNADAQEVNIPACISCYLGVTEPAMFGVNMKLQFPFLCGMIGSAIAAVVCVATYTTANAIGVGGLPGILSIQPQYMLSFALCMVIAIVVPFVLTVAVGKKKGIH